MNENRTNKERFFDILDRAIQPTAPKVSETKEHKKHGNYTDKQIHQRKSEDTLDSQNDKSHQ